MTRYEEKTASTDKCASRYDEGGKCVKGITRGIEGLCIKANANANANNNALRIIKYEGGAVIDLTQDDDADDDTNLNQDEDANLTEDDEAEDIPEKYAEKKGNRLKYYGHPP